LRKFRTALRTVENFLQALLPLRASVAHELQKDIEDAADVVKE
jgi:hypothetical protein